MSSSRMSSVHIKPRLDHDFSFRGDSFTAEMLADEPGTINDLVSKEDWYKVSFVLARKNTFRTDSYQRKNAEV